MRAVLVPADPALPVRDVEITDRGDSCAADVHSLLGDDLETIPYREDVAPFFGEHAKFKGLPANVRATRALHNYIKPGDYIAGDVVFVGANRGTGDTVDLPEGWSL